MEKIEMVDLKGQYRKIKAEVDAAVANVIETTAFINGPDVKSFAAELGSYLNVKHVIPCANGTDALQIAMMALDLQPGDEVITPSFTYAATCEVIALLKLTPVFVDTDPDSFGFDLAEVEKAITSKTKAVVPVHLYGQCADMEPLLKLATKHNLFVIEDVAQALGAEYTFSDGTVKKAGTMGTIGTTSFFPSKNLGCYGDGGAIFTNDDELGTVLRQVANHGQTRLYYHDLVGVNSRLDTMQAAILRCKLPHLDGYATARNKAADYYDQAFASNNKIKTPFRAPYSNHVFHQYTLTLTNVDRDGLGKFLDEKGVPNKVYYPVPQHLQKAYNLKGYKEGDLPVAEDLSHRVISLPMHTELTDDQLKYITEAVLEFVNK
jgi:UDP-2-acetamido-2-deoxy-ribo-hexuluronate aminotransferase